MKTLRASRDRATIVVFEGMQGPPLILGRAGSAAATFEGRMNESDTIAAGATAWQQLERSGKMVFEQWKQAALGIAAVQNAALRAARANRPYGKNYQRHFEMLIAGTAFTTMSKAERVSCYRLARHLPEIITFLAAQAPEVVRKLNHPDSTYWAWRRSQGNFVRRERSPAIIAREVAAVRRYKPALRRPDQDTIRRFWTAMRKSGSADYLVLAAIAAQVHLEMAAAKELSERSRIAEPVAMHA